jgi:ADP-ribosylglycohydrolase
VQPEDLLAHELVQSADEGKDVTAIAERWSSAGGELTPAGSGASTDPAPPALRALARKLLAVLEDLEDPPESRAAEPDAWGEIAALLPPPPVVPTATPGDLQRRVRGAWVGRAAGCLLGKPVEKIPRKGIEEILRSTGRWPLDRYFTAIGLPTEVAERWPWNRRSARTSLEENIDGMPEDDDLNYPLLALDLLQSRGPRFTTDDVAQLWLDNLPAGRIFTAERAAYRNILDARPVPETAIHLNPFREWIGALIRADVYGWVSPGDVRTAARLAWQDARLSHTRNGLYGAMWAAALCSSAMVCDDVDDVLDSAETVVPPGSRLAEALRLGRAVAHEESSLDAGLDRVHAAYGHLHWVHVLNNASVIAYALAAGKGKFAPSVAAAVMAGWDTDSAAATVGSVVGALAGEEGIGQYWTGPLGGRIATSLPGAASRSIDGLVERTLRLQQGTEGG